MPIPGLSVYVVAVIRSDYQPPTVPPVLGPYLPDEQLAINRGIEALTAMYNPNDVLQVTSGSDPDSVRASVQGAETRAYRAAEQERAELAELVEHPGFTRPVVTRRWIGFLRGSWLS